MDNKTVLEKIKKCLALSQSANEHEAAQALKQAQALMRKYELSEHDVELSKVTEAGAERRVARSLSTWQWGVGYLVADVFGCYFYKEGKVVRFYGLGNRAELAAYAFDVAAGDAAMMIGCHDGKDIQLHHAMNGADGVKQLGNGL